jgi:hypothetical protein
MPATGGHFIFRRPTMAKPTDSKPADGMAKPTDSKPADGSVVFRDKEFKSRTIVLGRGATVAVVKGQVTADTPELIDYFGKRTDFERVSPAAAE